MVKGWLSTSSLIRRRLRRANTGKRKWYKKRNDGCVYLINVTFLSINKPNLLRYGIFFTFIENYWPEKQC